MRLKNMNYGDGSARSHDTCGFAQSMDWRLAMQDVEEHAASQDSTIS
jgi:hypothetical protein